VPSWSGEPIIGEHLLCGQQRVEAVGLAGASLSAPWSLDLEHGDAAVLEVLAQAGAVAAGALDPDPDLSLERADPREQLAVAGECRGDRDLGEELPESVHGDGEVLVLVGVHAHCDHHFPVSILWLALVMWRPPDKAMSSTAARFYEVMAASVAGDGRQIQRRAPARGQPFYSSHPAVCHTLNGAPDATASPPLRYALRAPLRGGEPATTGPQQAQKKLHGRFGLLTVIYR